MTQQLGFTLALAFLSGVVLCVIFLAVKNGKSLAARRKKTKLGLVRVAGAGLKLDDYGGAGEPAADDAAEFAVNTDPAPAVDANEEAEYFENDEVSETVAVAREDIEDYFDDDGDDSESGDEPAGEYIDESVNKSSDEPAESADEDATGGDRGLAEADISRPLMLDGPQEYAGTPEGDPADAAIDRPLTLDPAPKPPAPRRRLPETVKMKERKVLLAEDVEVNRELITMFFDGSGVKLELAENGEQACALFEKHPEAYSLILMDIQMPVMDGYDAAKKIRSMNADWAKQIPIIAMTAHEFKEDIDLCFEAGMDDHIGKPINVEELQEKVFDYIMQNVE